MRAPRILTGLLALLSAVEARALDPSRALTQYGLDTWQSEKGLPHRTVMSLAQTADGYLWIATPEGLVRFDGARFTSFSSRGVPRLPERDVRRLLVDRQGRLLAGSFAVYLHESGSFRVLLSDSALPGPYIYAFLERRNGSLVVATGSGLYEVATRSSGAGGAFEARPLVSESPGDPASDAFGGLFEDASGRLWFGTEKRGLGVLDPEGPRYPFEGRLPDDRVNAVVGDPSGALWVGTPKGLALVRGERIERVEGLPSPYVSTLLLDRRGALWIGTHAGICRLSGSALSCLGAAQGLSGSLVNALLEDREGSLWIGTEEGGLSRLRDTKLALWGIPEGMANEVVRCTFESAGGDLWIGSYGRRLSRLSGHTLTSVSLPEDPLVPDDRIASIAETVDGTLLVATPTRLLGMKNGVFEPISTFGPGSISSLLPDTAGRLWVGTAEGLFRLVGKEKRRFSTADGLGSDRVRALHQDRSGRLWVGTNGGLSLLSGERFQTFNLKRQPLLAWAIHEEDSGDLWVGSWGAGLVLVEPSGAGAPRMRNLGIEQGLLDDIVYQVLEDDDGNLWMTSNNGIFRVSKRQAREVLDGRRASVRCQTYGLADGLRSNECNGGLQPAGCRTRDGRLWFPTVRGVAAIDPRNVPTNALPPPVMVEEVVVDERTLAGNAAPPGSQKLEFRYTATSLVAPAAVRFRYRLEGYDREWVEAGARRTAYYTHLSPGRYRFLVTACNNDGVWSEAGAAYPFRIEPRFHQTVWFQLLAAACLAGAAYGLYALRMWQLRSRFEAVLVERQRVARELHDTLAQGLAGAVVQIENARAALRSDPDRSLAHLGRARDAATLGLEEARRSVWALRSESLLQGDPLKALADFAKERAAGTDVAVTAERAGERRALSEPVEGELFRIAQEAVVNALRHARPRALAIRLAYESESTRISVEDDGCGFDPEAPPPRGHYGLLGMRERAERLGGHVTIRSAPGAGTRLDVVLPG